MSTPLRRLALFALCVALAVLAGVCAGSVRAHRYAPLYATCPEFGNITEIQFRHPATGEKYEVGAPALLEAVEGWAWSNNNWVEQAGEDAFAAPMTDVYTYFSVRTDAPNLEHPSRAYAQRTVIFYDDAGDPNAEWLVPTAFMSITNADDDHDICSTWLMPRATLDDWLAAVTATVTPEPRVSLYGLGG